MSEDQLQAACYQWFHNTYPEHRGKIWAVPNGGKRSPQQANLFKATGVVKGVHDLHFYHKKQLYTFELKVGNNKMSPDQVKWKVTMEREGAICYEIRDFETFKQAINAIIS
jgi:hypothetical protein